jgi:23S rRNA pseudouridine2457 synthase
MGFRYFLLNKPYGMLSQFSGEKNDRLLGECFNFPKDVYSVGRLDKDSEGLLLLTNDNTLKHAILHPDSHASKTYWVQVDGIPTTDQLHELEKGELSITHKGSTHIAKEALCRKIDEPKVWERNPPIRFRANLPTSWIELQLTEGKNRQVRKMTASVGLPTIRLIRAKIGNLEIGQLQPGEVIEIDYLMAQKGLT